MDYAPIIIPTLNRQEHLKRCVESLRNNPGSEKTDLFISVDYPPNEKYFDGYEDVKNYGRTIDGLNDVKIYMQDHNLGPAGNWNFLKNTIIDSYETFIESEDDNEFSPNFLAYINKGLELYKDNESITAICSSNEDFIRNTTYRSNYYKLKWQNARGIGTWFYKEKIIAQSITDDIMELILNDKGSQKKILSENTTLYQAISLFLTGGMPAMKDKNGNITPMDYTRSIYNILNDKYCIYPVISKSRNWGYDGSGENTPNDNSYDPKKIVIDENVSFDFIKADDFNEVCKEASNNQRRSHSVDTLPYIRARIIMFLHNNLNEKTFKKISSLLTK